MARDDWFRRTTWTELDADEFFARNRRSRSAFKKAQYMRIQAETLLDTGNRNLATAALELLKQSFREFPDTTDCALAYDAAGRCCQALGRCEEALNYYRRAMEREREFPGIGSLACFHFAILVAEQGRQELFDEALLALDSFGPAVFPWHAYVDNGARAIIASQRGQAELARACARRALDAASIRDSGLGWGRASVGLVKEQDMRTAFHRRLRDLIVPHDEAPDSAARN